jgi:pSer/pThr/pTyr-binding forkhead associated (FHA) protein
MEDRSSAPDTVNLEFPISQRQPTGTVDLPPGFVPLRLVLLPSGVMLELDMPDMTLGRHTDSDLRLPLPDVSRRHCRFTWSGGVWSVADLASLNGVYVNNSPIHHAQLAQNDLVRIGGFTFAVDLSYPDMPKVLTLSQTRLRSVIRAVQRSPEPPPRRLAS